MLFKKLYPRDYNLKKLENVEYDEFKVKGDNHVHEMTSNNPIGPSTGTTGTSSSIIRTSKRVRLTIWQHFRWVEVIENEKKMIKALCNYCERLFIGFANSTSHLRRHADKCLAKNVSNIGQS